MIKASTGKLRVVIAGYIVGGPLGGLVWHHLQYVLGLRQLGHDVLFVEDSNDYASCYNPDTNEVSTDPSFGLEFIRQVFTEYDLQDQWAYFDAHNNQWFGRSKAAVQRFAERADVLLNLSGLNPVRGVFENIPARAFVDTDPAFTQIAHLTDSRKLELARRHTHFFSYAENFGKPGCGVPDDGLPWMPTRQPVVLSAWPCPAGNPHARWTTVMQWDSYKVREFGGRRYGMKSTSFDDYLLLPQQTNDSMELAMGSDTAPRGRLLKAGWHLANPLLIARTHRAYQQYIQQSKGEWSIAKHGYVATGSGWFSERSASYLSTGRPVVVQDTGFSQVLETGKGLFAFSSPEEALECISRVNSDYSVHCRYARLTAEQYFDSDKVLQQMLAMIESTEASSRI